MVHDLDSFNPEELRYLERKGIWLTDAEYRNIFSKVPRDCVDAVVVPENNDQVLLLQRFAEPQKGMWSLPGGRIDFWERDEEAVKRKVYDETGLYVEIDKNIGLNGLVGRYDDPKIDRIFWKRGEGYQVDFNHRDTFTSSKGTTYLVRPVSGSLRKPEDSGILYFPWNDLPDIIVSHHFKVLCDAYRHLGNKTPLVSFYL